VTADRLIGQKLDVGSDGTLVERRRVKPDLVEWSGTLRNSDPGWPRGRKNNDTVRQGE